MGKVYDLSSYRVKKAFDNFVKAGENSAIPDYLGRIEQESRAMAQEKGVDYEKLSKRIHDEVINSREDG